MSTSQISQKVLPSKGESSIKRVRRNIMEYEPQKYLHKTLLYHHLYLGHTHTKTSQNIPNTPWRFSRTPSLATASTVSQSKPQTLRSTRPTTLDPILQGPQGPRPRPAVSTSWQKPGLASSRCFRRSRKSSKPGMASRMKNDVIRCSKSRSVRNVIPWLYLNIAKIDVFLPFFTISGSWLLFREHIWQRTWRCSRSMGLPLSHNSLRLLAELILQNCW
jgi:hypothetical protein